MIFIFNHSGLWMGGGCADIDILSLRVRERKQWLHIMLTNLSCQRNKLSFPGTSFTYCTSFLSIKYNFEQHHSIVNIVITTRVTFSFWPANSQSLHVTCQRWPTATGDLPTVTACDLTTVTNCHGWPANSHCMFINIS